MIVKDLPNGGCILVPDQTEVEAELKARIARPEYFIESDMYKLLEENHLQVVDNELLG